jgi:hypothetical protein
MSGQSDDMKSVYYELKVSIPEKDNDLFVFRKKCVTKKGVFYSAFRR